MACLISDQKQTSVQSDNLPVLYFATSDISHDADVHYHKTKMFHFEEEQEFSEALCRTTLEFVCFSSIDI